ncbi:MAG: SDR family oxidoreductase [Bacteroidota bacterium]
MAKILITGAAGEYGKSVIKSLIKKGFNNNFIYALVSDEDKAKELKLLGIKIIAGNYDDCSSLVSSFAGIDKLFFVPGNDIKNRIIQHKKVIKAAKIAGIKHIFYTSQLHKTDERSSPIHFIMKSHLAAEVEIMKSGINYTIFRNGLYLETLPMFLGEKFLENGIILPAGQGKMAFSLRTEMAEAAANILTSEVQKNKIIDISGDGVSFTEIASMISQIIGKNITYLSLSYDTYINNALHLGMQKKQAKILGSFAAAAQQGELEGNKFHLEKFLERKPTTVVEFLQRSCSKL